MKKKIVKVISAILLMALAMSLMACGNKTIYDELGEEGFTVRVRFDAGGAVVNETQNVTIVEVFNEEDVVTTADGKKGILLLAPDDPVRGSDGMFKLAKTDGESNFFQAGWYTKRTLRVDAQGKPLDAYGVPTEVSQREQGYVYEGKWDFDKDVVDPDSIENGELTLYAAWIPFFNYEFYAKNESGAFEKIGSKTKLTLLVPEWDEDDAEFDMKDFPEIDGKEYVAAYFDEDMTQSITENVDGRATFVDYEKGIVEASTIKIYIDYKDVTDET